MRQVRLHHDGIAGFHDAGVVFHGVFKFTACHVAHLTVGVAVQGTAAGAVFKTDLADHHPAAGGENAPFLTGAAYGDLCGAVFLKHGGSSLCSVGYAPGELPKPLTGVVEKCMIAAAKQVFSVFVTVPGTAAAAKGIDAAFAAFFGKLR